jgi:predicted lipopolysaccharide heptosyltransferase III
MLVKGSGDSIKDVRRVLLIQLGDIGDVVWATPTFRAVKETCPEAEVSVLLREDFGSLLEADPSIHRIFEVKRGARNVFERMTGQIKLIQDLRDEPFDLVVDLRFDDRGAFMAFLSGAPARAALFRPYDVWRNRLFTHIAVPERSKETICRAAEQSLRVVREFGFDAKDSAAGLSISESVKQQAKKILNDAGVPPVQPWITVNPFSRWSYKEWGYGKWAQIVDWLEETYRVAIVIVGSAEERQKSIKIFEYCRRPVYNLTGKTRLNQLAGVLSLSHLHIGVDSAAPHIAAATGTPSITFYGPSDWREWAPDGDMHEVIAPDRECAPCHQKGCGGSGMSECREALTVDRVKDAIQGFLNKTGLLSNERIEK